MTIGEKIKKLRTDKMMSQSELAGGEITRNMLSQIEHGSATPSLGTVKYIAERLNVSPGFLLAEDEDEKIYLKQAEINDIKKAYRGKNFELCRQMCLNCGGKDDELYLILAHCTLKVGTEEFCNGNLHLAAELIDEALEYCDKTVYDTEVLKEEAKAYFSFMELISPSLSSSVAEREKIREIALLRDGFAVYSDIICSSKETSLKEVPCLSLRLENIDAEGSYSLHVKARLLMEEGKYTDAHGVLYRLLCNDGYRIPEPMLYLIFCDLEVCCKENSDFKGAYEYSGNKMTLLQKLLA